MSELLTLEELTNRLKTIKEYQQDLANTTKGNFKQEEMDSIFFDGLLGLFNSKLAKVHKHNKQKKKAGVNWSNCPYWEQCEDENKHIMTYCDAQCFNPSKKPRLDRPELREGIEEQVKYVRVECLDRKSSSSFADIDMLDYAVDKILALFDDERNDTLREVGELLEKKKKRSEEHYSGRQTGTPDSTGGIIALTDTYYLIPKSTIEAFKKGEAK